MTGELEKWAFSRDGKLMLHHGIWHTEKDAKDALGLIQNMAIDKTYKERGFKVVKIYIRVDDKAK